MPSILQMLGLDPETIKETAEKIVTEFQRFNRNQENMLRKLDAMEQRQLAMHGDMSDIMQGMRPAGALNDDPLVAKYFTGKFIGQKPPQQ